MSIILNTPAGELPVTGQFIGDTSELAEMATDMLTEVHNFTVALARLEHRCLNEEAITEESKGKMLAGAKEWVKSTAGKVAAFFQKLWAWIKEHAVAIFEKVFGPRADWMKRDENKKALSSVTEEQLKAAGKVEIGANLQKNLFGELAEGAQAAAAHLVKLAVSVIAPEKAGFIEKVTEAINKFTKSRSADKSDAAAAAEFYVGAEEEVELSKGLVFKMERVVETTIDNIRALKGIEMIVKGAATTAAGRATQGGDDSADSKAKIDALMHIGPKISAIVSTFSAINAKGNAQAMAVLVRAAAAARKGEKPAAEGRHESASLLAEFMPA